MRWLAGTFDPRRGLDDLRLSRALEPDVATVLEHGVLRVAHSGPPASSSEPLCLLDGYIYNARELRSQLASDGGETQEELLALGYRRWGLDLPARLRGDFALLVWDPQSGEGLLARDQLGVRSLFLHERCGGLAFASEVRQLLALLPRRPAPDPVAVAHWLAIRGRPGSDTVYEGVRRLPPGAMLVLDRRGSHEQRYWEPRFREPLRVSTPELAAQIRAVMARAVERRLDSDGRAGVLMSGGLDSSSIAAVAADLADPGKIMAYSAVFPDHPRVDEAELIGELRTRLGLSGMTARVGAGGLLASALEWTGTWQVPLVGWGEFWAAPLSRAAARAGARVMLDGEGGDQLFGRRVYLLADRLRAGRLRGALSLARELAWTGRSPPRRRALARPVWELGIVGALPPRLEHVLLGPWERRELPSWLRAQAARSLRGSEARSDWKRLDGPRWWAHSAYAVTRVVEEFGLFEHYRRRAATAGLESRHPLFDLDLLELGLRQPPEATVDRLGRPLLRAAMDGLMPDAVRLRPGKALFDSLLIDTLAGPDRAAIERLLSGPKVELGAYVELDALRDALLVGDGVRSANPFLWMYQLWRVAAIECWLRIEAGASAAALAAELGVSGAHVDVQAA